MSNPADWITAPFGRGGVARRRDVRFRAVFRPLHLVLAGLGLAGLGKLALLLAGTGQPAAVVAPPIDPPAYAAVPPSEVPHALPEPAAGPEEDQPGQPEGGATGPAGDKAAAAPATRFTARELELLGSLVQRRNELDERERLLALREELLDDAEAQLALRLGELEELKRTIEDMVRQHDAKEEEKLASLVKIYETMKPKAAAEIFDRLQMDVLIEVVARMRESKSSDVIGRMEPERARRLTAALAQRRQLPVDLVEGPPAGDRVD